MGSSESLRRVDVGDVVVASTPQRVRLKGVIPPTPARPRGCFNPTKGSSESPRRRRPDRPGVASTPQRVRLKVGSVDRETGQWPLQPQKGSSESPVEHHLLVGAGVASTPIWVRLKGRPVVAPFLGRVASTSQWVRLKGLPFSSWVSPRGCFNPTMGSSESVVDGTWRGSLSWLQPN